MGSGHQWKKIDTFEFSIDSTHYECEVTFNRTRSPHSLDKDIIEVVHPPTRISVRGTDINEVRRKIMDLCAARHAYPELWVYATIHNNTFGKTAVSIEMSFYLRHERDGKILWRSVGKEVVPDPWDGTFDLDAIDRGGWWNPQRPDYYVTSDSYEKDEKKPVIYLAKATVENVTGLRMFEQKLKQLAAEVRERFSGDQVEQTLNALLQNSGPLMLEAGQ